MIQDKTNCSFESIQHTESTDLKIFRNIFSVLVFGIIIYGKMKCSMKGRPYGDPNPECIRHHWRDREPLSHIHMLDTIE